MEKVKIVKIVSYTIPYFGNKHSEPYGKLLVDGEVGEKIVKFEGDKFKYPSFTYNWKRYFMTNVGTLYEPKFEIKGKIGNDK